MFWSGSWMVSSSSTLVTVVELRWTPIDGCFSNAVRIGFISLVPIRFDQKLFKNQQTVER